MLLAISHPHRNSGYSRLRWYLRKKRTEIGLSSQTGQIVVGCSGVCAGTDGLLARMVGIRRAHPVRLS